MNAKELMIGDVFLYPDDEGFVAVSVVKFDRDAVRVKRNDGHMFNIVPELLQPRVAGSSPVIRSMLIISNLGL